MKKVAGQLRLHPDGYGFVIPDEAGLSDIFIPRRFIWPAMHGDMVDAKCTGFDRRGRAEGKIAVVVERGARQIVGRFELAGKSSFVRPHDPRFPFRVYVEKGGAGGARPGDTVVAEITRYPTLREGVAGRVIRRLGERGDISTEVEVVIRNHQLPTEFHADVQREADSIYRKHLPKNELSRRADMRHVPFVTIDGESARDFDDAVAVEAQADGNSRVYVAIADVSFFVRPDSKLDEEALSRGTSVYFPNRCLPMFPHQLADDLCSLKPLEDKLVVVAEFVVTNEGAVKTPKFYRAVIQSRARLTYTQVWQAIEKKGQGSMLDLMASTCRSLQEARRERGSIDFDLPEPEIILDMEGGPEAIVKAERNFAHMMIEELMIAANEAVARFLTDRKCGCIYRVHESPPPDKIRELSEIVKQVGLGVRLKIPPKPADLARIVAAVKGRAEERFVNHTILRSMAQAVYDTKNVGHFGLASKCYCHFTSPIRRYPDLAVHRLLVNTLGNDGPVTKGFRSHVPCPVSRVGGLQLIAQHSSRRERVAMEAERDMAKLYAAIFLRERVGDVFGGVVSHIAKFGVFVELTDYFIEGVIYKEDIGRRHLNVGDRLRVRLLDVKVESREVRFVIDLSSENVTY